MLRTNFSCLAALGRSLVAWLVVLTGASAKDIAVGPGQFLDDAIARAEAGDRILLAPGTYAPRVGRFVIDKALLIEASGAPLSARLIGSSTSKGPTLTVAKASAVILSGLGIQSVWSSEPALDASGAQVFVRNCVLRGSALGVCLGARRDSARRPLESVLIHSVVEGTGVLLSTAVTHDADANPLIRNTIFVGWGTGIAAKEAGRGEPILDHSGFFDVRSPWPDHRLPDTCFTGADPLFMNPTAWDYRLALAVGGTSSPCIDRGHPDSLYADVMPDHRGTLRADLGPHGGPPAQGDLPIIVPSSLHIDAEPVSGIAPLEVSFDATFVGGDGAISFEWHFGDGESEQVFFNPDIEHVYEEPGTYHASLFLWIPYSAPLISNTLEITVDPIPNRPPHVAWIANPASFGGFGPLTARFEAVGRTAGNPDPDEPIDPDENIASVEWTVDGASVGEGFVLLHRFADTLPHSVSVKVEDASGVEDSYTGPYSVRRPQLDLLQAAAELGDPITAELRGNALSWARIFYSRAPYTGGEFDGFPLELNTENHAFGDLVQLDAAGKAEVTATILEMPATYRLQAVVASDPEMLLDRMLSTNASFYLFAASCDDGGNCFTGRLMVRKLVEVSRYDTDYSSDERTCKLGYTPLDTDGDDMGTADRCVRFENVAVPHTKVQVFGVEDGKLVEASPPAWTGEDGTFQVPPIPGAPLYPRHVLRVFSQSRHANVQFGNYWAEWVGTTVEYDEAWECARFDRLTVPCGLKGKGIKEQSFLQWINFVRGNLQDLVNEQTGIVDSLQASRDLALAHANDLRELFELALNGAIQHAQGQVNIIADAIIDTLENIKDFFECVGDCKWWEWVPIPFCPIKCTVLFTIEELEDKLQSFIDEVKLWKADLALLLKTVPIVRDWIVDDLQFLLAQSEIAFEQLLKAADHLKQGIERLKRLVDHLTFLVKFLTFMETNQADCAGVCENYLLTLFGIAGFFEYILDSRLYEVIARPERTIVHADLWAHSAPPFGGAADFGEVVIEPEAAEAEDEYIRAYQFAGIIQRVEQSYAAAWNLSNTFRSRAIDDDGIVDVIYPHAKKSFYHGLDFDRNGKPEIAIDPSSGTTDTVVHEYGHFVHDKLVDLSPLPVPFQVSDFKKEHFTCEPDDYSDNATYTEGFADFFQSVAQPWPNTTKADGLNLEFSGTRGHPCNDSGPGEEVWTARILWELWNEKAAPILPQIHPGLLTLDEILQEVGEDQIVLGLHPPTTICELLVALVASGKLAGGEIAQVAEIYRRNTIDPGLALTGLTICAAEDDRDQDGVVDPGDNCPETPNPGQEDADGDETGDVCDNCPDLENQFQTDNDFDGVGDICEALIEVEIDANPIEGAAPLQVQFHAVVMAPGSDLLVYDWDFAGDGTSIEPDPAFAFIKAGKHRVRLTVTNESGHSGMAEMDVTVNLGFKAGDADGDGDLTITDAIASLNFQFQGGPAPLCGRCADTNGDGILDITDPLVLLNFLFLGGPRPR